MLHPHKLKKQTKNDYLKINVILCLKHIKVLLETYFHAIYWQLTKKLSSVLNALFLGRFCDAVVGFSETGQSEASSCSASPPRSLMSTSPGCPRPAGCLRWATRSCFRKKTQKENFIEMAEGATTLKGLRAQMGKKTVWQSCLFCRPACVFQRSNHFVMFAANCRR